MQRCSTYHTKICQCNPPLKQTERKKPHNHLIRYWKNLWQKPTPIHDKGLGKNADTRNIPKHKKALYYNPIANIKSNGKKLQVVPLKSGARHYPPSPYQFTIIPAILARVIIKQQKEIKGIQIGKEEGKVSLFTGDIKVYINDPQNSTRESHSW